MSTKGFVFPEGYNRVKEYFHYIPNKPLAYTALVIYAIFTIYLTVRIYRSKSPRFLYILAFTGLMETAGYAIRIICIDFTDLNRFIGTTLFILLAPNAVALVNYKAVGEIIRLSNVPADKFYLRTKFVTWFFFGSDIFAFVLQGAGGSMLTNADLSKIGNVVTLVGLGTQLFFFASFAAILVYIHRSPKYNYYVEGCPNAKRNLVRCLYATIGLIYVRSIYRIAEYATGYSGPIAKLEWAFYAFDSLAIAISFLIYSVFFIGNYLPKYNASVETYDGKISVSEFSATVNRDVETNK